MFEKVAFTFATDVVTDMFFYDQCFNPTLLYNLVNDFPPMPGFVATSELRTEF